MFKYIKHKDIDKPRWNESLEKCINAHVYAYTWYLDTVSPNWDALVWGDYEMLFPLTHKTKYGIRYLCQPLFIRYFDIYATDKLPEHTHYLLLLRTLKVHFKFIEINILKELYQDQIPDYTLRKLQAQHYNYSTPAPVISHSLKQNLNRAKKAGLKNFEFIDTIAFSYFTQRALANKIPDLKIKDFGLLKHLMEVSIQHGHGITIGIKNENGIVLSGEFMVSGFGTQTLVIGFTHEEGKKNGAMSYLRYEYIQAIKNQEKYFDFGGSNLPGVAQFNLTFGSTNYHYSGIKHNSLPAWVRIFKK